MVIYRPDTSTRPELQPPMVLYVNRNEAARAMEYMAWSNYLVTKLWAGVDPQTRMDIAAIMNIIEYYLRCVCMNEPLTSDWDSYVWQGLPNYFARIYSIGPHPCVIFSHPACRGLATLTANRSFFHLLCTLDNRLPNRGPRSAEGRIITDRMIRGLAEKHAFTTSDDIDIHESFRIYDFYGTCSSYFRVQQDMKAFQTICDTCIAAMIAHHRNPVKLEKYIREFTKEFGTCPV